jgi:hypothetical protein
VGETAASALAAKRAAGDAPDHDPPFLSAAIPLGGAGEETALSDPDRTSGEGEGASDDRRAEPDHPEPAELGHSESGHSESGQGELIEPGRALALADFS